MKYIVRGEIVLSALVQANAIAANVRNQEVFGGVVDGAEWHETMRHVDRDGEWEENP